MVIIVTSRCAEVHDIPDLVMEALDHGTFNGTSNNGAERYRVVFNDELRHVNVVVGSNGFIVTARPYTPAP